MYNIFRKLGLKLLSLRSLIILSISSYYFITSALVDADSGFLTNYKTIHTILIIGLFIVYFTLNHRPILKIISRRNSIVTIIIWLALTIVIRQPSPIFMLFIVLSFYDRDYKKMTGYLFTWTSALFITFSVLSSIGIISSGEIVKSNLLVDVSQFQTVTALGLGNPNTTMAILLGIIMSGAYIFYKTKYKNRYGIFMLIISIYVYSLVGSRTGLICAIIFLSLYILDIRRISVFLKLFTPYIMIALLGLSIFIGFKFGQSDNIVNNLLTTRPYQWRLRLESGALTNIIGNSDKYFTVPGDITQRYPLDNQYIYTMARYGWITLVTTLSIYFVGLRRNNSPVVTYMILISVAQCFVESQMFMAIVSIGLLFILSDLLLTSDNMVKI